MQNRKGYVSVLYRFPSQKSNIFEKILGDSENLLNDLKNQKSFFKSIIKDFVSGQYDMVTSYHHHEKK